MKGIISVAKLPLAVFMGTLLSFAGVGQAFTGLNVGDPISASAESSRYPVEIYSTQPVSAVQIEVLFDPSKFSHRAPGLSFQASDTVVRSHQIEPGRLRVVTFRKSSGSFLPGPLFDVPLNSLSTTSPVEPIVLSNLLASSAAGNGISSLIQPNLRLTGIKRDDKINGRLGIELSLNLPVGGVPLTRVEYFIGGVLMGESSNAPFSFNWQPETSGPAEVLIVGYNEAGDEVANRLVQLNITHVGTYEGPVLGTYAGLVRGMKLDFANEGYVSMTSTIKGVFTLKLLTGDKKLAAKGIFDSSGNAIVSLPRGKGTPPLTVVLAHSSTPPVDQIHGRVADGDFTEGRFSGHTFETEFTVDRLVWNAKLNPATMAGGYTLLLHATETNQEDGSPYGTGFGTASVAAGGAVKSVWNLADGTKVTSSTHVSKDGAWPMHASPYKSKGILIGQLGFVNGLAAGFDVGGTLSWMRPLDAKAMKFQPGFMTEVVVAGGSFAKPLANQRLIPLANLGGNASLILDAPELEAPMVNLVTMLASNKVMVPLQNAWRTTVMPVASKGLISGKFFHPETQKTVKYQGAVLQSQGLFAGYFLGGERGGEMQLIANGEVPVGAVEPIASKPLPMLKIASPKANSTTASASGGVVTVKGTAMDKQGIASVTHQVFHGGMLSEPSLATGTTAWSFDIPVPEGEGGLYTVHVKATDTVGNESEVVSHSFRVALKADLTVTVNGPGTVTKGFAGTTQRDVGTLLTLSAKAQPKKKFLGWTGSVVSSAPTITVLMEEGMNLQASFAD